MLKKIGLSSRLAFANAASFHACQSTGLCACCKRYGLVSLASGLVRLKFALCTSLIRVLVSDLFNPIYNLAHAVQFLWQSRRAAHAVIDASRTRRRGRARHSRSAVDLARRVGVGDGRRFSTYGLVDPHHFGHSRAARHLFRILAYADYAAPRGIWMEKYFRRIHWWHCGRNLTQ